MLKISCLVSVLLIADLSAHAQEKVGLVDTDKIRTALVKATGLDSLVEREKDTLNQNLEIWQSAFWMRASNIKNHFDGSAEDWEKIETKLKLELADMGRLNAVIQDSLPAWRNAVLAEFQLLITEKSAEIAKKKKLKWVFDRNIAPYFESKLDITGQVMKSALTDEAAWATAMSSLQNKVLAAKKRQFWPMEHFNK